MLRMSKLTDYGTVIVSAMARDPDAIHSVSCFPVTHPFTS